MHPRILLSIMRFIIKAPVALAAISTHGRRYRRLVIERLGARHDNARYFYRPAGLRTIINIAVRLNNKSRHEIAAGSRADRGGWLKVLFFPRSSLYNMESCLPARLARS